MGQVRIAQEHVYTFGKNWVILRKVVVLNAFIIAVQSLELFALESRAVTGANQPTYRG